nr:ectonucleotide pyrophosphatase/phosphodiesterase family member 7 [Ciona intestinalis]|eukprot:XP_002131930.1 ectonucleotide pyrophosphatase/phosphodiesterase family member 7 [Ciona intestinalis]
MLVLRSLVVFLSVQSLAATRNKLLLISFDGFSPVFAERVDTQAFSYLNTNGVRAKFVKTAFPTLTTPSHVTIATGLYSESHGVVHNLKFNRSHSGTNETFYTTLTENDWWDNGAEPIWITAVKQGLRSGGYRFPGSYATYDGFRATKSILDKEEEFSEDEWRMRVDGVMSWFVKDQMDVVALYFEYPDLTCHELGMDSEVVTKQTIPLINRTILYLLDKVKQNGLIDNLNIIITSDHGFENVDQSVTEEDVISLSRYVDESLISFRLVEPFSPLALIDPVPGQLERVYNALKDAHPKMDVYKKSELSERLHFKNNDRIPSIIILAHPGHEIYWKYPGYHKYKADHGFDNALESMNAIYYSIGPSFKKNYVVEGFESVHIYPLMCHLLGIEPAVNNGSLDVLRETLVHEAKFDKTLWKEQILVLSAFFLLVVGCLNYIGRKKPKLL